MISVVFDRIMSVSIVRIIYNISDLRANSGNFAFIDNPKEEDDGCILCRSFVDGTRALGF